jgi:hypothetical protein
VLNRPIDARVSARFTDLSLSLPAQQVHLAANETRAVTFSLPPARPVPQNVYSFEARVDASAEGTATLQEDLHVNRIANRTISVDGDLKDGAEVLPQILPGTGIGANLTQEACLPCRDFTQGAGSGLTTAYVAYDDHFFYFAAKIADATPDAGMLRFSRRDDDSYLYPTRAAGATLLPTVVEGMAEQQQDMSRKHLPVSSRSIRNGCSPHR